MEQQERTTSRTAPRARTLFITLAAVALVSGSVFFHYHFDDPFYAYRYARNLADGRGWEYNPGDRLNASTSTLHTLLLALAARCGASIPATAHVVGTMSLFGAALLLARLLGAEYGVRAAWAAPLLLLTQPLIYLTYGKELMLVLLFALLILRSYRDGNALAVGWWGALLILTRPDGALLVMLVLLAAWRRSRRVPWPALALLGLLLLPWLIFSWYEFGTLLPASLGSKSAEGLQRHGWPAYLVGIWYYGWLYKPVAISLAPLTLLALGGVRAAWRAGGWLRLALLWGVLHFIAYSVLHVPPYEAYYVVPVCAAILGASLSLARLNRVAAYCCLGLLLALQAGGVIYLYSEMTQLRLPSVLPVEQPRAWDYVLHEHEAYRTVGQWLCEHTPPGARVACWEAGIIGYYSDRVMTDKLGVVTPPALSQTLREWLRHYRPDYGVFLCDYPAAEFRDVGGLRYAPVKRFQFADYLDIVIYKRLAADEPLPAIPTLLLQPTVRVAGGTVVFSWEPQALGTQYHTVDCFIMEGEGNVFNSAAGAPPVDGNEYRLPEKIWDAIPPGTMIYWRVNCVLPHEPWTALSRSNMQRLVKR